MDELGGVAQPQAGSGEGVPASLALIKPLSGTQITLEMSAGQRVDFRQILNDPISFFHVGENLQLVFEDGSTIVIVNFFSGDTSADNLIVGDDRFIDIDQFVDIAQVQTTNEIQTAAGDAASLNTALGGPTGSGADFQSTEIGGLGDTADLGSLLGTTADGLGGDGPAPTAAEEINTLPIAGLAEEGLIDEDDLPDGTDAASGAGTVATGSLGIDFGDDGAVGRGLTFNTNGTGIPLDINGVPLDLTSDGIPLVYSIVGNGDGGQTLTATQGVGGDVVFTVLLETFAATNGLYTFTLFGNLDHVDAGEGDDIPVTFSFNASDANGDDVDSFFLVTVTDDAPEIGAPVSSSVNEDDLPLGNDDTKEALTTGGDLDIAWGSDNGDNDALAGATGDRTLTFDPAQSGASGLTSAGDPIVYVISADGTILTGVVDPGGTGERTVFTVTLNDDGTGSYTFTLSDVLDHPAAGEDGVDLSFDFNAKDGDGDVASDSFVVTVADDTPEGESYTASTTLDDEAQTEFTPANDGGLFDPDPNVKTVSGGAGTLFSMGADGFAAITLTAPAFDVVFEDANGFAQVESVSWDAGTTDASGTTTWTASSANHAPAAVLVVNADGSYSFTLNAPIAHDTAAPLVEENEDLDFSFTVTDGDGDTAEASLRVSVNDDTPVAYDVTAADRTDDEGKGAYASISNSGAAAPSGDVVDADGIVSGAAGVLFSAGADGVKSVDVDTFPTISAIYDNGGVAGVEGVTWSSGVTGTGETVWTATGDVSGQTVATLTIGNDGSYSFEQSAPLAHSSDDPTENDDLALTFDFTVTDGDDDTASGSLTVNVNDDTPEGESYTASTTLDDEAQTEFTPTNDGGLFDPDPNVKTVSGGAGTLFTMGADGFASITLTAPAFDVVFEDANGFAQVESVSWDAGTTDASGTTTWTASSTNHAPAAVLVVNADGSYSFTLNAPIAHDTAAPLVEENEDLDFSFTVTDGDGDTTDASLRVSVNDDTPVAYDVTAADLTDDEGKGDYASISNPGAAAPSGDVVDADGLVSGAAGVLFSAGADGVKSVDVDTFPTISAIYDNGGVAGVEGVTWSSGVTGTGETVWTATGDVSGQTVATLTIGNDGSYSFEQSAPLAHSSDDATESDDLALTFDFTVTDGDDDTASGSLTVNVNDDTPEGESYTASTTLDDEAQTEFTPANDGGLFDPDPNVKTVSGGGGTLFSMGADGFAAITLTAPAFDVVFEDANGFAQVESVSWDAGTTDASGTTTWTASSANHAPAAVLVVNADGSYSFTLTAPIAHDTAAPLVEENEDLDFSFTVTDGDGDTAEASLRVSVNDDTPTPMMNVTIDADTLDDEAQTEFTPTNDGGLFDADPNLKTVSGGAGTLFSMGADGLGTIDVSLPGFNVVFADADGFAQTETITWSAGVRSAGGATTWTASSDHYGEAAVLVINADGSYSFTMNAPIEHAFDLGFEENANLPIGYTATDGDGDQMAGVLNIAIDDDTPVAYDVTAADRTDDEGKGAYASISNPGAAAPSGDVVDADGIVSGAAGVLFSAGADGVKSVDVDTFPTISAIYDNGGVAGVEGVTWSSGVTGTGETVWTATGDVSGQTVATLTIGNDGSYSFEQSAPLAHSSDDATESDDLALTFDFTVTDGDDDTDSGSLTVNVNDDTPVVSNPGGSAPGVSNAMVDEDDIVAIAGVQPGGTDGTQAASVSGTLLVDFGADGFGGTEFTGAFNVPNAGSGILTAGDATGLDSGLDSDGVNVFFRMAADGQSIEGYKEGTGEVVLRATLDTDSADWTVDLLGNIDHQPGDTGRGAGQSINFTVAARDGDGDILDVTLSTRILDDEPTASYSGTKDIQEAAIGGVFAPSSVNGQLVFDGGADGATVTDFSLRTVLDMDAPGGFPALQSNGVPVDVASSTAANGVITLTGTAGGAPIFTMTVQPDGQYVFELQGPVDHPDINESMTADELRLVFDFTVTDGDGDSTSFNDGTLQIDIRDDAPTASYSGTQDVQEATIGGVFQASSVNGQLVFDGGADGATVTDFSLRTVLDMDAPGGFPALQSNGVPVDVSSSTAANGVITLTGTAGGAPIFTMTVQPDGQYVFELQGPVDHPDINESMTADELRLVFDFTVTDGDGDSTSFNDGTLQIDIRDDAPTASPSTTVWLDDDDLAGGNPGGTGDNNAPVNVTGMLNHSFGADADGASISWSGITVHHGAGLNLTHEVTDGGATLLIKQDGVTVVTGTLNQATGAYEITQQQPISHVSGGDENQVTFQFRYTVTDGDGDTASSYLWVNVDDDTPELNGNTMSLTVDEDDIATAWSSGTSPDDGYGDGSSTGGTTSSVGAAMVEGDFSTLVNGGADQPLTFSFVSGTLAAAAGLNLTSGGTALTYTLDTSGDPQVLTGSANGHEVLTITLDADGGYVIALSDQLDHADGQGQGNDLVGAGPTIVLGDIIQATDGDSDAVLLGSNVTLQITDDVPVISAVPSGFIDADVLVSPAADNITGSLGIEFGADDANTDMGQPGDRAVTFTDTGDAGANVTVMSGGSPVTLTSGGETVSFAFDGDTLVAFTGGDPSVNQVFTVALDDASGEYDFTLLSNLDYAGLSDAANNVLDLSFDFTATDSDGDTADGTFQVTVDDTSPVRVYDGAGNLVGTYGTIQEGVDNAADGYDVVVLPGTYAENVTISAGIDLISLGGSGSTIIQGVAGGPENGTVTIVGGTDNVSIGTDGTDGFTIVGFDNGNPGIEQAAVYVTGGADPTENFHLIGNELQANGEAALLSEWNAPIVDAVIQGNVFSGQTFTGAEPATGDQFTVPNVARQLVAFGQGSNPATNPADNITFTDNQITGTAGGTSAGNNLVTIDAANSTISGNTFTGYTNGGAVALRARGPNTDIENNTLDHTTGGNSAGMYVDNQGTPGDYSGNVIYGGTGNEFVTGMTPGNDLLEGSDGDDVLNGGGGNDIIRGGGGNDTLLGGDGNDRIGGKAGDDTIIGGAGNDRIWGDAGDDTIIWNVGDGDDHIVGGTHASLGDRLIVNATAPGQTITVSTPGSYGTGFTVAVGSELVQVDSVEELTVDFTAGSGTLVLVGDFAASGIAVSTITVEGGDATDIIDGSGMVHSVPGSDVRIVAHGNDGDDTLIGGVGDDMLYGDGGNDVLSGGRGVNTLDGGAGTDTADYSNEASGAYIRLDAGWKTDLSNKAMGWVPLNDAIAAGTVEHDKLINIENITGTAYNDLITGNSGDNVITGGDGNDRLGGLGGNDTVIGGEGNDKLFGDGGNDTLEGGEGNDTLTGGTGFNVLDGGDGVDKVDYSGEGEGIYVRLDQGWGTDLSNKALGWADLTNGIAANTIEHDDLISIENVEGTDFTDNIVGNGGDNVIMGLDGADYLAGLGGNDTILGGDGNDLIVGGTGDDTIKGGAGNDRVNWSVGDGADTIDGGADTDTLRLFSTAAGQTITLGATLGVPGFTVESGGETVTVSNVEEVTVDFTAGSGSLVMTGDFASSGINVSTIHVEGGSGDDVVDGSAMVHSSGSSDARIVANGNDGDDTLRGGVGDDLLSGGNDNDVLAGNDGDDTLDGGAGNDRISGGAGSDTMIGGEGDDVFFIDGGDDTVYGNGTDTGVADNVLAVSGESDTVVIYGDQSDHAITRNGDGSWTVENSVTGETNQLFGIEGIDFNGGGAEVDLTANVFVFDGSNNLIGTYATIQDGIDNADAGYTVEVHEGTYAENLTVSEGITLVGVGDVSVDGGVTGPALQISGGGAGESFEASNIDFTGDSSYVVLVDPTAAFNEVSLTDGEVSGGRYNGLWLNGATGLGGIVLDGMTFTGNGTAESGGSGEGAINFYLYNGDVTLTNVTVENPGSAAENGIQFRGVNAPFQPMGNVTFDGVIVTGDYEKVGVAIYNFADANGLDISGAGLTVNVDADWHGFNIDGVGGTLDLSGLPLSVVNTNGNPFSDIAIQGLSGDDTFSSTDSDDKLVGNGGNDVLHGGGGDDLLVDGKGTVFDGGAGSDTADVSQVNGKVSIDLAAGTGGYNLHGTAFTDIENLVLNAADTNATGQTNNIRGSDADNRIEGSGSNDLISGFGGDDVLLGGGGNDTIDGGTGANTLDGGAGNDTLRLSEGADSSVIHYVNLETDTVSGGSLDDDTIANFENVTAAHNSRADFKGDAGDNTLIGSNYDDVLRGEGGNDTLIGDTGYNGLTNADVLIGGTGDDTLKGGGGSDTLYGNDTDLGVAENVFAQAGENDVAVFDGAQADHLITRNVDGSYSVEDTTTGRVDTLYGIEGIAFGGGGVDVDLTANVFVFDGSNNLIGTYATIQDGIDNADAGYTVEVHEGTYAENLLVTEGVTLVGVGDVSVDGGVGGPALRISGGSAGESFEASNIDFTGDSAYVVLVDPTASLDEVSLTDGEVSGGRYNGLWLNGATGLGGIVLEGMTFTGNATEESGGAGEGALSFYLFNGDVTLTNVTVENPGSAAENGIQFRGVNAPFQPMGNVTFDGVIVTGDYEKVGVAIYNFADANGLDISGAGLTVNVDAEWHGFNIDGVGETLDLSSLPLIVANTHGNPFSDIAMQGLSGDEVFTSGGSSDLLIGNDGDDKLIGGAGSDLILGGEGNDILEGKGGADEMHGGEGNDTFYGNSNPDLMFGDAGDDIMNGQAGSDEMHGGADNDALYGGSGNDVLYGDEGNDTLDGYVGNDALIGGSGQDTATFGGELDASDFSIVTDADPGAAVEPGWQIDASAFGEGIDTLTGIEVVQAADPDGAGPATGRFLLVGNGGYATIQEALNDAAEGDTVMVAEGTYTENLTISTDNVSLVGVGDVVIEGTFKSDNGIAGSVGDYLKAGNSYSNAAGRGLTVDADGVTVSGVEFSSFYTGVELADGVDGLTLNNVDIDGVINGIRKGTTADVTDLTINGGTISDGAIGIYFAKTTGAGAASDGLISDVEIIGTTFEHLLEKGIYAEALSDALITGIVMNDVGEFGRAVVFGGTGANTSGFGNGIDINLKNGSYSGIVIENFTFTDVGTSDGDGTAHDFGAAISLKARDDGSYSANPADYSGDIIVRNGSIDGTSTGVRAGEPGKSIDGPSVVVENVEITDAIHSGAHGDIDNVTQSTMTVTGDAGNDVYVAGGNTTGDIDFAGFGGADSFTGGEGDDTFTGGADDDVLDGADGTDTAQFADSLTDADITANGSGGWTVTTATEGTDTLTNIEIVDGAEGGQFLLVGNGGYATIQEAIDAASDGDTILIGPGTWSENLSLDKAVTLIGSGSGDDPSTDTILNPGGTALTISGDINDGGSATVTIKGINFEGNTSGIRVASGTIVDTISVDDSAFNDNSGYGFRTNGNTPGVGEITVTNTTFADNGQGGANGSADLLLWNFFGDATIENVAFNSSSALADAASGKGDNALQITGFAPGTYDVDQPIGTISLINVTTSGSWEKPQIMVQGFNDLDGLTFANVALSGSSNWGDLLYVDPIATSGDGVGGAGVYTGSGGTSTLDLSGVTISSDSTHVMGLDSRIRGTDADDIITGTDGNDLLNDFAEGGIDYGGDDEVYGGAGDDTLIGGLGEDYLQGNTGNDRLYGGADDDTLRGGKNDDYLEGGTGDDTVLGDLGDDTIVWNVGDGNDTIDGGTGVEVNGDTLRVVNGTGGAETIALAAPGDGGTGFSLTAGGETSEVDGIENVEVVLSDAGDTVTLTGDFANSGIDPTTIHVAGGDGADTVNASAMASSGVASEIAIEFDGGAGDDSFHSGVGDDTFDGGADLDTAHYTDALAATEFALSGANSWTLTSSTQGTDTLTNVEVVDGAEAGRFLLVGNGGYATIQEAVDAAVAGDTVLIAEGTYAEQVVITTSDISLVGVGDVVIEAPASGLVQTTTDPQNGKAIFSVVTVDGADNVDISSITVDGEWQAGQVSGGADFTGIAYMNSSGSLDQVEIMEIGDTPINEAAGQVSGNQRGQAILVSNTDGFAKAISITNSSFMEFQKTGVVARNAIVTAEGNTFTTVSQAVMAQNGIQLSHGSTGSILGNTFTGFGYSGGSWASVALLVFSATGLLVDDNAFAGTGDNDYAVYLIDTEDSTVTNNLFNGVANGVTEVGEIGVVNTVANTGSDANTYTGVSEVNHYVELDPATQTTVLMPIGSDGVDAYYGGAGNDTLDGRGGNDTLLGGGGEDTLLGGDGDDHIEGGEGDDIIDGGAGDDTIVWNVGGGHDIVDGGADTDTFLANGEAASAETFDIYSNAAAASSPLAYGGSAEIVIARNGVIIAELDNIEEIVIDGQGAPAGTSDTFNVHGSFVGTSLAYSTIRLDGGDGDDTVDISGLSSAHRIVFTSNGGHDVIVGDMRAVDVINLAPGTTIDDYDLIDNGNGTFTLSSPDHSVTFSGNGEVPMFSDDNGDVGNLPPIAYDDVAATNEDTSVQVNAADGLLGNDVDLDGDTLSITEINGSAYTPGSQVLLASGALLTVNADGSYDYDPNGAFEHLNDGEHGVDSFTYKVIDAQGREASASAEVTVDGVTDNDAPVANSEVLDFTMPPSAPDASWSEYNGHFYKLVGSRMTWDEAYQAANAQGGYLVQITTYGENSFVHSLSYTVGEAWIGASDRAHDGQWRWIGGEENNRPLTSRYQGWASGEPNNYGGHEDYASIKSNGTWNDLPGTYDLAYVVEHHGVSNGGPGVSEDVVTTIDTSLLLANDTDADGDALSVSGLGGSNQLTATTAKGATVTLDAGTGEISYDPTGSSDLQGLDDGESTTDSFTYWVSDGNGGLASATATLTVDGADDVMPPSIFSAGMDDGSSMMRSTFVEAPQPFFEGTDGDDILVGSDADDLIAGGLGSDMLTGGLGQDTFVLNSLSDATDFITDFEVANDDGTGGDAIDLQGLLDGAFGAAGTDIGDFVRVTADADGSALLEVNANGLGNDWTPMVEFADVSLGDTIRVVVDDDGSQANIVAQAVA